MRRLLQTNAHPATVLIRLHGWRRVPQRKAFRNFCIRQSSRPGRFAKIGIPAPEVMGPFVAGVETSSALPDYRSC